MAYVAYYIRKADYKPAARYIRRGFACTREELPLEMATHCGAIKSKLTWIWVSGKETANILLDVAAKDGYIIE